MIVSHVLIGRSQHHRGGFFNKAKFILCIFERLNVQEGTMCIFTNTNSVLVLASVSTLAFILFFSSTHKLRKSNDFDLLYPMVSISL